MLARPAAFRYKDDPQDFFFYTFIVARESISDCASLVVYQSNLALVPPQFSADRNRLQNVRLLQDVPSKQYPLLLSTKADEALRQKVADWVEKVELGTAADGVTMRSILLQETLLYDRETDFIKLQVDSNETILIADGAAY